MPDLAKVIREVFRRSRPTKAVTRAKASLNNGQSLYAVNDIFVGPKTHGSARDTIHHDDQTERHSSSGVIISIGMGSSGWLTSLLAGARAITAAARKVQPSDEPRERRTSPSVRFSWEADHLGCTVREPFPSKTTGASVVTSRAGLER